MLTDQFSSHIIDHKFTCYTHYTIHLHMFLMPCKLGIAYSVYMHHRCGVVYGRGISRSVYGTCMFCMRDITWGRAFLVARARALYSDGQGSPWWSK